jgi:hypothetical protein
MTTQGRGFVGKAKGGAARAAGMTPERRKEISLKASTAKKELSALPRATHGSVDHPLTIGDIEIPCYVLEDGTRVLSQRGLQTSLGMSISGGVAGEQRIVTLLEKILSKSNGPNELSARIIELIEKIKNPIKFRPLVGGNIAYGFEATVLADICESILVARKEGILLSTQARYAEQCEVLVRGFARVGIIALVDEATGYQRDRAKDALAKILEAFVAKELQPWVKTFPADYYEQLFRLYKMPFPPEGRPQWRPQFFGTITNEVVYNRIAPELLPELKKAANKAEKKAKLHQWLTQDSGHPKLREHLASLITLMKLSKTPEEWRQLVDRIHPRQNATLPLNFEDDGA